jgi:hypothetical protein
MSGTNLGGGIQGHSPQQTVLNYKDGSITAMRSVLRRGWNTQFAQKTMNGKTAIQTPFRLVNNSGDFLSRKDYVCGGSNPSNAMKPGIGRRFGSLISQCDSTNIPGSYTNVKYVPDSSEYTRFKKQQAYNRNYNDLAFGGYNNSAYVDIMRIRR